MRDFTDFDLTIADIEKEHFTDLHQPLSNYFTVFINLDDSCSIVWKNDCITSVRNKVIVAANKYLS